ncbi:MAG TPA: carboxypeptidase-like regulatory domain-containing protein [Terriglobales bacterium]|nr:carboxypeptidase-like regulatory domain-containing protein [Terriglobales bacterium]
MKWRIFALVACLCGSITSKAQQPTLMPEAPKPQTGVLVGTVTDVNNDTVPGATVVLEGPELKDLRTVVTKDNGFFQFSDVQPGATYHVTVRAEGFANWTSPTVVLKPGQYLILTGSKLNIAQALTTITVASPAASPEEIAREQVKAEEKQRIFGILPNFYVVYDRDVAPLTPKLKFKLATKVLFDPVTVIGVATFAGINQAADNPNYGQGAKGYAERFGAGYADGAIDIMVGGAILPSLLHQDPRYFYQGTGSNKSRALHALSSPFVCRGDNGRSQPNYSTLGGDLATAALANAYYPASNRGAGLFLGNFFIATGQRALANVAQEFVLRKITSKPKDQN